MMPMKMKMGEYESIGSEKESATANHAVYDHHRHWIFLLCPVA